MKKIFLCFVASLLFGVTNAHSYQDLVLEGVKYRVYTNPSGYGYDYSPYYVEVISNNYSGDITIREYVEFEWNDKYEGLITTKERVYAINPKAFTGCSELTSISIPKSVEYIGGDPLSQSDSYEYCDFSGCNNLNTILIDGDNVKYEIRDNCIVNKKTDKLVSMYKDGTIPESIKSIGSYSIYGRAGLYDFVIPKGVEYISSCAFVNCRDLSSVTVLGNCNPNQNESDSHYSAFVDCPNLKKIVLSCDNIPYLLCGNNSYVESIVIQENVSSFGESLIGIEHTFPIFNNKNLKEIYSLPTKPITSISDLQLDDLTKSTTLYVHSLSIKDYQATEPWSYFTSILPLPEETFTLTYLIDGEEYKSCRLGIGFKIEKEDEPSKEGYSFSGWSEIPETMPDHDVTVTGTFSPNTYKLTYYVDGDKYKVVDVKYDEEITPENNPAKKGMTFSGWIGIPEKMPAKDVTVTGVFSWSKVIQDGVIYQVYNAEDELADVFGNDNASGEVKIVPSVEIDGYKYSVTDIVDFSFKNNTDITSVVIPESVRKIGDEAFYGCKNLAKIELGKSVNQIEPRAFASIDKLTDITVYAEDVPDADRTAFENSYIEDYVTLHVPAGSVEMYKAVAPWKNFKEIVAIEGTENIEDNTEKDEIKIGDIGKTTYCSEYDLDFTNVAGIKAYTATGYDNKSKTIWLTRVMTVPAGTGILVKGDAGTYKVPRSTEDAYYTNMFKGNTGDPIKIEETEGDMTNYYLSGKDGSFVSVNGSANIGKNKAYLQLPTKFFAGTRSIGVTYDDEGTTGIWTIEQGALKSERDVWYNLQGQRVDKPKKGLYIRNGKKVVVR